MDGEWLSITEAAARLTASGDPVDRSTLSRYLTQHAEAIPTEQAGRSKLVEFGALIAHRGENVRLRPVAAGARATGSARGQAQTPTRFPGSQVDAATRDKLAVAEMREMDLAKRRRELTPTAEVDQAGREAVVAMQSAFEQAIETEAATLAVRYGWDEKMVRIGLKAFMRAGFVAFHRVMLERIEQFRRAEEFGEPVGELAGETIGVSLQ